MKLKRILLLVISLCGIGIYASAQQVTIDAQSVRLEQILDEISDQTGFSFYYSRPTVDPDALCSVSARNQELTSVLDALFSKSDITYDIRDRKVYLIAKAEDENPPQGKVTAFTVKGRITDSEGAPVIGAAIMIQDTNSGSVADVDGNFSLSGVKSDDVLEISSIGYKTQEIPVGSRTVFNVMLETDARLLEEVVVVGYGTQTKVNLTGSVATVTNAEIADRPTPNVSTALQGLSPGLMVTQGSGTPGDDGATIRIRGIGTLNTSSPYILVDGIETGTLDQIDPNDIESISVLKDASSAAIYGSKASNGVILVTTKRGYESAPKVSYSGLVSFSNVTSLVDRLSSYDYARMMNELNEREGIAPQFSELDLELFQNGLDPDNHPNSDWTGYIYRTGVTHKHNLSITGGNDNIKYMVSGSYLDQEGTLKNSDREQFNIRANFDIKLSDKFSFRSNFNFLNNNYSRPNASARGDMSILILTANRMAPWIPIKRSDGTYGYIGDGSPAAWLDADTRARYTKRNFSGTVAFDYHIIDGLTLTAQGAYVSNLALTKNYQKEVYFDEVSMQGPTTLTETKSNWERKTLDLLLNYEKTVAENHNFKVLLGYNMERYDYWNLSASRENFTNTNLTDMNAGEAATMKNSGYTRALALMSYFGRFNYDYKGKYLFEANFRSDASSRFAKGYRWGYFPSFSAGWRITEEPWMASVKPYVQNIKLRASWGKLGNQNALADDYFPYLPTLYIGKNFPFDGKVATGITVVDHKVNSITWEKSRTYGVGLDMTFLKDFSFSFDWYNRLTTDIIMEVSVPWTFGISGTFQDNKGSMVNRGAEFSLAWNHYFRNDFRLGISANYSLNKNEILDLAGVDEMVDGYSINRVGNSYGAFYVYKTDGLFKSDEEAAEYEELFGNPFQVPYKGGDVRIVDTNGDGEITPDDRIVTDSRYPEHTYAASISAGWKGFDLSVVLQGAAGVCRYFNTDVVGYFGGDTSHPSTNWLDSWTPDNPDATWPRAFKNTDSVSAPSKVYSDFWCMDTSYLRIKSVNFSYTFPKKWTKKIRIDKIQIYYAGENLYTFDSLPFNVDPEVSSGNPSYYPTSRTHSIGLNITF